MAIVDINGKLVDFPDDMTPDQLQVAVKSAAGQLNPKPSLSKMAWDSLAIPEQKSSEGLQMIAQAVSPDQQVTGNMARDVAMNTPRIAAETLAEVAPSFISRGSMLTAGGLKGIQAAKPLIKAGGTLAAKGFESLSGLEHRTPGVLVEAAKDSGLMFAKNRKAASAAYEAAKAEMPKGANLFENMEDPKDVYTAAKTYLAQGGTLEPSEALIARKAVDKMIKSKKFMDDALIPFRSDLDAMAKKSANIAMADPIFGRGIKAEALRNILPQNKYGGASTFRSTMGALTTTLPFLSPMAQGAAATALGSAGRALSPIAANAMKSGALAGGIGGAVSRRKKK